MDKVLRPKHLPTGGIQTLDRSSLLIELIAQAGEQGMTAAKLEEHSGISIATIYRLVQALRQMGLLRQPRNRGPYLLGYQLIAWGNAASQTQKIRRVVRPTLQKLTVQFDCSFFLFVPDGYNVLCLDIQDSSSPTCSYAHDVGGRIRHGLGQASIAILSHLPDTEYQDVLAQNQIWLHRDYGISRRDIDQASAMCRHLGFTGGVEGRNPPDFTGLACPILDFHSLPVAAISCSLPRTQMTESYHNELCDGLEQHRKSLQHNLYNEADAP